MNNFFTRFVQKFSKYDRDTFNQNLDLLLDIDMENIYIEGLPPEVSDATQYVSKNINKIISETPVLSEQDIALFKVGVFTICNAVNYLKQSEKISKLNEKLINLQQTDILDKTQEHIEKTAPESMKILSMGKDVVRLFPKKIRNKLR